jgi:hypothetical protein
LHKKDQLASRSFRRRAVKPADKIARDFILVRKPKPFTGFAWNPGVESRRSDRSPLHDVRQRRRLKATQTDKSRTIRHPGWWSQTGSNRRPPACKAGALPTELWPRRRLTEPTTRGRPGFEATPGGSPKAHRARGRDGDRRDPLSPRIVQALMGRSCRPQMRSLAVRKLVGLGRLERPTSPLSGVRSNHLSYRPESLRPRAPARVPFWEPSTAQGERRLVREEREA